MTTSITKWGNSLAVRIPQNLAKKLDLAEGSAVEIVVVGGNLVTKPVTRKRYSIDALIQAITRENLHAATNSGVAIGNEAW